MKIVTTRFYQSATRYVINFVQTQLIITIASIPLLVGWGLGISAMTFVGNLIFAPVLTIFLAISSLILLTQILSIPNQILVQALDQLTSTWDFVLHLGSRVWMIEFANPGFFILLVVPLATFFIIRHRMVNSAARRIICMSVILAIAFIGLLVQQQHMKHNAPKTLSYEEKLIITNNGNNKLTLVDQGFFATKKSAAKIVSFEIKPDLIKNFGRFQISNLTITKASAGGFDAAHEFCSVCDVKAVTLPFFTNKLSKSAWRSFFKLRELLVEKKIAFVRPIGRKKID
jgi:hypothetical protein